MKWSVIILTFTLSCPLAAKVILWDLGGVLFEPSKLGVAREVGLSRFISHALLDLRSPNIQPVLFDVLMQLDLDTHARKDLAGSADGLPLPPIMCKWQSGLVTGQEIIDRAEPVIKKLFTYDYFESEAHRDLISECIKKMFNATTLSRNVFPVPEGIALLRELQQMTNKNGTKKHRHFVFSNWDHCSFDSFHESHKSIFNQFEAIIISGHIKKIKPNLDAFEHVFRTYNILPSDCILIDDQEVNVKAARECGMEAILIKDRDYKALRKDLIRYGLIPKPLL